MMAYLQALLHCSRYLMFTSHAHQQVFRLPLAPLYIQRTATPNHTSFSPELSTTSIPVVDLVRPARARIVLNGPAGSGKHVLLHWLMLVCAAQHGILVEDLESNARIWAEEPVLPVFIDGRRAVSMFRKQRHAPTSARLQAFLQQYLEQLGLGTFWPTLQQGLAHGSCLVLVHGLDAIPSDAGRRTFLAAFEQFAEQYPDNRFIIVSRHPVPVLSHTANFAAHTLDMLDIAQQESLITRWVSVLTDLQGFVANDARTPTQRIARLHQMVRYDPAIRQLAAHPLALASLVIADAQGVPKEKQTTTACASIVTWMLDRALKSDATPIESPKMSCATFLDLHANPVWSRLPSIAFALQSRIVTSTLPSLSRFEMKSIIRDAEKTHSKAIQPSSSERHIQEYTRSGILALDEHNAYHMPLGYVRAYLAAMHLAQLPDFSARVYQYSHQIAWSEALDFATQMVAAQRWDVYEDLLQLLLAKSPDVLRGARYLAHQHQTLAPAHALRKRARDQLLTLIEAETSTIHTRIEAGTLLGLLGHPALDGPLPPMNTIDGGLFIFGTSDKGYPDEGPQRRVDLPSFAIGTYPVTNQEYARFLVAQPDMPQPRYWHDPRFNNPAQPVVGITWNEATAYTTWLTAYVDQQGLLPEGRVFRLPLEVEWEKAASWNWQQLVKQRYPWGDSWVSGHANTAEERDGWVTTPVGCYPQGASAYGVHDLVGNVWEWMANEYTSYPGAAMAFHEPNEYVLRGSSCVSNAKHARCTYRGHLCRDHWRYHLGFRVVLARALK